VRAWLCRFSFFLSGSLSAQAAKPLLLGLASISGGIETLYVTKKIGAFKRNGLDVDFTFARRKSGAPSAFCPANKIDQRKTCVESTPSYG
jgi:hypothetical protein